jgi:RNA polymerase-binding protein
MVGRGSPDPEREDDAWPTACSVAADSFPREHDFEVPFANDAEAPATWECRLHGSISKRVDGTEPEQKKAKPPRTHWDMLLERRSMADLEVLLNERLELLAERRAEIA